MLITIILITEGCYNMDYYLYHSIELTLILESSLILKTFEIEELSLMVFSQISEGFTA